MEKHNANLVFNKFLITWMRMSKNFSKQREVTFFLWEVTSQYSKNGPFTKIPLLSERISRHVLVGLIKSKHNLVDLLSNYSLLKINKNRILVIIILKAILFSSIGWFSKKVVFWNANEMVLKYIFYSDLCITR